jgi:hypothetical protein
VNLWHPTCANRYRAALADPPVKVPELPPDPLDEHGAPLAAHTTSTNSEQNLSPYTIRELAVWYIEEADRRRDDPDLAAVGALQNAVDSVLRQRLAELGVFPEFIGVEFERVMQVVFAV